MAATKDLHNLGQSLWLDNITRTMLDDGTLARYIAELSVTGLTSNPTIFDKAISKGDTYDEQIAELADQDLGPEETFFELALADLRRAAGLFADVHDRTDGTDGFVSLEVSPLLANDAAATIAQAADLHGRAAPNTFIKIPGTPEGREAIEETIFAGIPVNVTLLFSTEQYLGAAEAYMRGLERRVEAGLNPFVASVASVFVSRWDAAVTDQVPADMHNTLGIALCKQTYKAYLELIQSDRWLRLANEGARPQRALWASTGTKDPNASDTLYIDGLASPFTVNTMPEPTLLAYADHGAPGQTLPADGGDSADVMAAFEQQGVSIDALATKLQVDGAASFVSSWTDLLKSIESERAAA